MELQEKIVDANAKFMEKKMSTILLTLNSKLNLEEAKLVSEYSDWKKI